MKRNEYNIDTILPERIANPLVNGINSGEKKELIPSFNQALSEKVYSNGNSWIVLGRDRPTDPSSGYGGANHTKASSIDIVVGRQSVSPDATSVVENNFGTVPGRPGDAARMYISQRANIDEYFGLPSGYMGMSSGNSAIAVKADDIRIIARRGVKIVTGRAPVQRDNIGRKTTFVDGVEIIAGGLTGENNKFLQPMVKGDNLILFLKKVTTQLEVLNSTLRSALETQTQLNTAIVSDISTVVSTFGAGSSFHSSLVLSKGVQSALKNYLDVYDLFMQRNISFNSLRVDYLSIKGSKYINSRYNKVN